MGYTVPTNKLETQTVSSSFDQLLYLDNADGLEEATLHVVSTDRGKSAIQLDDERLLVRGVDTSNAAAFEVKNTGGTSVFKVNASSPAITLGVDDTGADFRVYSATTNEGLSYVASADEFGLLLTTKLKFHDIGGGEEIFASADGHLEINAGTTLDMTATTIDMNGALDIDGTFTQDAGAVVFNEAGADYDFRIEGSGAANALFVQGSDGFVGIGTAAPSQMLEVSNSSGDATIRVTSSGLSNNSSLYLAQSNGTGITMTYDGGDDKFYFIEQTPATLMTISNKTGSIGYVGIGTASPSHLLHVKGAAGVQTKVVVEVPSLDADNEECTFYSNVNGIGMWAAGTYYNDVAGGNKYTTFVKFDLANATAGSGANHHFWCGTDGNYYTDTDAAEIGGTGGTVVGTQDSDERLKNISSDPFPYGLTEVNKLTPIAFTWKPQEGLEGGRYDRDQLGFGAQTLQKIIPEPVIATNSCPDGHIKVGEMKFEPRTYEKNKLDMEYHQLVPVLVKAIQELSAEVEALKNA